MAKRRFSPDFEKRWQGADVILNAFNANGRKLYAEKKTLGENSTYFNAMFFAGFQEANKESVDLSCDYDSLLKILQFIYDPYLPDWCPSKGFPLMDLYITADYLNIPEAKRKCLLKIREDNDDPVFNAFCAQERDLPNIVINIMENMTAAEVYKFLLLAKNASSNAVSPLYSKKNIALICRRLIGREIPQTAKEKKESKSETVSLEMIYREIPEPMIDLKKTWPGSDVTLQTKDSKGKLLYSNKGVLTSNSPYFQKLFSNNESGNDKLLAEPIPLDVNYITMKMILELIHNCDSSFTFLVHGIHPVLLYEMYSAASEEKLDIPFIRELCCRQLKTRSVHCLEVAIKLGLHHVKNELLNSHYESLVADWLCVDDNNLKYISDGKEVVLSTGKETPVLSIKELFVYFDRIHREAHAKPAMRGDNVVIVDYLPLVPIRDRTRDSQ